MNRFIDPSSKQTSLSQEDKAVLGVFELLSNRCLMRTERSIGERVSERSTTTRSFADTSSMCRGVALCAVEHPRRSTVSQSGGF